MGSQDLPDARVTEYTVSHTFDTFKGGNKSSHFVSMRFTAARPATPEEAEALALRSSMTVTRACVYHALARGAISVEEANDLISAARDNHERISAKLASVIEDKKGEG